MHFELADRKSKKVVKILPNVDNLSIDFDRYFLNIYLRNNRPCMVVKDAAEFDSILRYHKRLKELSEIFKCYRLKMTVIPFDGSPLEYGFELLPFINTSLINIKISLKNIILRYEHVKFTNILDSVWKNIHSNEKELLYFVFNRHKSIINIVRYNDLIEAFVSDGNFIVYLKGAEEYFIRNKDELEEHYDTMAMASAWQPNKVNEEMTNMHQSIENAVNPDHYKEYIEEYQWIDAMSKIPTLRKPERFIAAVEMQIRKYMDRNEQKDEPLQEWKKARFYMCYLVAYIENGNKCIPAAEMQKRLKGL